MKNFKQFVTEAVETSASAQAKKMGLRGDGHGDWYDNQGNLKAKTVGGKLKIFTGREPKKEEPKEPKNPAQVKANRPKVKAKEQPKQEAASGVVVVFGRFNPPTIGHEKLLNAASSESKRTNFDLAIYPSRTQDAKKNPLEPSAKIGYMKKMFPDFEEQIVDDEGSKTIFDVLSTVYNAGYKNATIMVGQDRLAEFQGLAQKYNGSEMYEFENIIVLSGGTRDPDADDVSGMSASKLRSHAASGDFNAFARGVPNKMNAIQKKEMYNAVRKAMKIKEDVELWEIAPKFDPESLRESYRNGEIFNIGDIVENLNTGLVGKITRRGTNHIICVTENGLMFKSWLRDIKEYTEVKMDSPMRDEKHSNTLVGTKGFFKYVASMTPGALGINKRYIVKGGKAYK
jgi:nicotinic acid mononucleotide adenylyltransferase